MRNMIEFDLAKWREARKLKQEELAALLGTSRNTIIRCETTQQITKERQLALWALQSLYFQTAPDGSMVPTPELKEWKRSAVRSKKRSKPLPPGTISLTGDALKRQDELMAQGVDPITAAEQAAADFPDHAQVA